MVLGVLIGALLSASGPARLHVLPEGAVPGGVLVVEVWGYDKPEDLSGELVGQKLHFFTAGPGHQKALVGLKLETKPGDLPVEVQVAHGAKLEGTAHILAKEFPKRELKVLSKFVSPPKSVRAQIEADKKAINKAYDVAFGPTRFVGQLSVPRPGAETTAHFGDQRTYNGKKKSEHYGTDYDGKTGEPILSAAEGEVVMARGCYMSGNTVIINHGGGLFTSYFHMSRMDVKPGDKVGRGQQLGLVGMTGRVTGPHLHFGVKVFSRLVDAEEALKLALGQDPPAGAPTEPSPAPAPALDAGLLDAGTLPALRDDGGPGGERTAQGPPEK